MGMLKLGNSAVNTLSDADVLRKVHVALTGGGDPQRRLMEGLLTLAIAVVEEALKEVDAQAAR